MFITFQFDQFITYLPSLGSAHHGLSKVSSSNWRWCTIASYTTCLRLTFEAATIIIDITISIVRQRYPQQSTKGYFVYVSDIFQSYFGWTIYCLSYKASLGCFWLYCLCSGPTDCPASSGAVDADSANRPRKFGDVIQYLNYPSLKIY